MGSLAEGAGQDASMRRRQASMEHREGSPGPGDLPPTGKHASSVPEGDSGNAESQAERTPRASSILMIQDFPKQDWKFPTECSVGLEKSQVQKSSHMT